MSFNLTQLSAPTGLTNILNDVVLDQISYADISTQLTRKRSNNASSVTAPSDLSENPSMRTDQEIQITITSPPNMSSGFSFWKKEVNKHVPIYRVTVSDDVEDGQVMVKFVVLYQGINEWTVEFSVLAEWSEHGKLLIHATEQTIEDQDVIQNTGAVVVRLVSGGTQRETPLYAPFVNMGRLVAQQIFAGLKRVYEVK